MLIKSGIYLQKKKTAKISIAFYSKFNVKHLFNLCLDGCKTLNCTKTV